MSRESARSYAEHCGKDDHTWRNGDNACFETCCERWSPYRDFLAIEKIHEANLERSMA